MRGRSCPVVSSGTGPSPTHRRTSCLSCLTGMSEHLDLVALLTRYGALAAQLEECTDPARADLLRQQLRELDRQLDAAQQRLRCNTDQR